LVEVSYGLGVDLLDVRRRVDRDALQQDIGGVLREGLSGRILDPGDERL
jgi:hypothetical protein